MKKTRKIKIYEYIGSYGAGLEIINPDEEDWAKDSDDWEYIGTWDLPEDFIDKCLPITYIE